MTQSPTQRQIELCGAPLPAHALRKRKSSRCSHAEGRTCDTCLSYVDGLYVKLTLNDIFGPHRWDYEIVKLDREESPLPTQADFTARVRLTVTWADGTVTRKEDVGYGNTVVKDANRLTVELAVKEAVTDALKRAAVSLGTAFGAGLYDKYNPVHSGGVDWHGVEPEPQAPVIDFHQQQRGDAAVDGPPDIGGMIKTCLRNKSLTPDDVRTFFSGFSGNKLADRSVRMGPEQVDNGVSQLTDSQASLVLEWIEKKTWGSRG